MKLNFLPQAEREVSCLSSQIDNLYFKAKSVGNTYRNEDNLQLPCLSVTISLSSSSELLCKEKAVVTKSLLQQYNKSGSIYFSSVFFYFIVTQDMCTLPLIIFRVYFTVINQEIVLFTVPGAILE